jgi:hypothetical protein
VHAVLAIPQQLDMASCRERFTGRTMFRPTEFKQNASVHVEKRPTMTANTDMPVHLNFCPIGVRLSTDLGSMGE